MRETVVNTEVSNTPLCIVLIDFKEAFYNISHSYLFALFRGVNINTMDI